jgi:hypothetical protein
MIEISTERKRDEEPKPQFLLTGFTQTAAIRVYAFERRVDARLLDYTVEVDLALISGYGIRIQELPLLCRELLQQKEQPDEIGAYIFTEQRMRSRAEELAAVKEEADRRKKERRSAASADPETGDRPVFRQARQNDGAFR